MRARRHHLAGGRRPWRPEHVFECGGLRGLDRWHGIWHSRGRIHRGDLPHARTCEPLSVCRRGFLILEPLHQVLEGRGNRHNVLRAVGAVSNFNQPGQRIRRKGAQPGQHRLVLRSLSAHQEVHGHIATQAALPSPEALWTFPRQRFDQLVLLVKVHMPAPFPSDIVPRLAQNQLHTRPLMVL
jgi:hypothetical protein